MDSDFDDDLPDFDIDGLLRDAIVEALSHEDPQRFLAWLQRSISTYFRFQSPLVTDESALRSMTTTLGRSIWNAMPLPGNHFHPKPLTQPKSNDPCPCESGRAYGRCCGHLQQTFEVESGALWPLVFDRLPKTMRLQAVKSGCVPIEVIIHVANEYQDNGHPRKAAELLELAFEQDIDAPDEAYDFALNALCDHYDDLGFNHKKVKLLRRMTSTLPRSPLRAAAWQRLSAIHMDKDDTPAAWEAFKIAQRDDPDSLGIGVLELQLLVADNRIEQARQRARFWVKRMRKLGYADDTPPMDHLLMMAKDPLNALTEIGMSICGGAGARLQVWLERLSDRALPRYEISTVQQHVVSQRQELYTAIDDRLRNMGGSRDLIDASVGYLCLDILGANAYPLEGPIPRDDPSEHEQVPAADASQGVVLTPPQHIAELSDRWHTVFPVGKPLSIYDEVLASENAWDLDVEDAWSTFLEHHPQAFDSLDILDDLATALIQHPQFGAQWLDHILLAPVLKRALGIVAGSLEAHGNAKLIWEIVENRPTLRSLARLAMLHGRVDQQYESELLMRWLLKLNPEDHHGFRGNVMNGYLRNNEDKQALSLSERSPGDVLIEMCWGRVLAFYRLGQTRAATQALYAALVSFPNVLRQLTHERVRKPSVGRDGLVSGRDYQAWVYRQAMRHVWKSTPGVFAWMKKTAKGLQQGMPL